jgi:hypothetical protein
MNQETVMRVAQRAGVGLEGVDVRIGGHSKGVYGWTHESGDFIVLFENAFQDERTLAATLGHERTHVWQLRTYSRPEVRALYGGKNLPLDYAHTDWSHFGMEAIEEAFTTYGGF